MTIDSQLLTALRIAPQGGVSGTELSQKLGLPRSVILARIQELRSLGYEIDVTPHSGYRLCRMPDVLHADDLLSRLGQTRVIGRDIHVFQETTSTNDVVEKLARDGVREGIVVFSETQTKGRGRLGRKWISPVGKGLWLSVLLRPDLSAQQATRLTIAGATALSRAIQGQTHLRTQIKWPNDILLNGRKIAGILTELWAERDRVHFIILGIGIDVNVDLADLPEELHSVTSSLKLEGGHLVDRAGLAALFLRELDHDYERVISGCFDQVADEWEALCSTLGRNMSVQMGDRLVRGRAESLDADGALLVRTEHGLLERILGGDVMLEDG